MPSWKTPTETLGLLLSCVLEAQVEILYASPANATGVHTPDLIGCVKDEFAGELQFREVNREMEWSMTDGKAGIVQELEIPAILL